MNLPIDQQLKQQITILTQTKQYDKARQAARRLVKLNPKDIEAWFALSQLEEHLGDIEQAILALYKVCQRQSPVYGHAVQKAVDLAITHSLPEMGVDPAKALVKLNPKSASAHYALGRFWYELGQNLAAIPLLERAIQLNDMESKFYTTLSLCQFNTGQCIESIDTLRELIQKTGEKKAAFNLMVPAFNYPAGLSNEDVFAVHKEAGQCLASADASTDKEESRTPNKKIRVGYLSFDFRNHAVSNFFKGIIESHNKSQYQVYCYFDGKQMDATSKQIKRYSDVWKHTFSMSDDQLHKEIVEDRIDILVDLSPYLSNSRLGVIAKRAAPIQVNYLGYPNTSGIEGMDYRLTDGWADPEGMTESQYSEKLVRLEGGFLCYTSPDDLPGVAPKSVKENQAEICFGSFNSFVKIRPEAMAAWAKILNKVDKSSLFVKAYPLSEKALCEKVWAFFENQGISRNRIRLKGLTESFGEHLKLYEHVDIHLDTYPYNGTTTTIESLRQGVPVVTLAGDNHRSRVGCSILTQVGLEDLIAQSEEEYIDIAVNLAQDAKRLKTLRRELRDRVDRSSLMDRKRFITELEDAYLKMLEEITV